MTEQLQQEHHCHHDYQHQMSVVCTSSVVHWQVSVPLHSTSYIRTTADA